MMVITTAATTGEYANTPVTLANAQTTTWVLEPTEGTTEAPLESFLSYVKSEHAATWMREECELSMMMFTDEDDQSYSTLSLDTEGDNAAVDQFIDDLASIYNPITKEIYLTATVNPSTEYLCEFLWTDNQIGYRLEQLATYYSGNINDLCSDYETWNTATISTEPEEDGWKLTYLPNHETITVYIDNHLATAACEYREGVVYYQYEDSLANGTEIVISYEIDKNKYFENECPL